MNESKLINLLLSIDADESMKRGLLSVEKASLFLWYLYFFLYHFNCYLCYFILLCLFFLSVLLFILFSILSIFLCYLYYYLYIFYIIYITIYIILYYWISNYNEGRWWNVSWKCWFFIIVDYDDHDNGDDSNSHVKAAFGTPRPARPCSSCQDLSDVITYVSCHNLCQLS